MNKRIFSNHIFVYPFRLESKNIDDKNLITGSPILDYAVEQFVEYGWEIRHFDITEETEVENLRNYNSYSYFHTHSGGAIFSQKRSISKSFRLPCDDNSKFEIEIPFNNEIKKFTLRVEEVSLIIFETEIGILSISLANENPEYNNLETILLINDYSKRIYPQFLGEPDLLITDPLTSTKNVFFPHSINFNANYLKIKQVMETKDFLGKNTRVRYIDALLEPMLKDFEVYNAIDDRMYVLCWFGNNEFINRLKQFENSSESYCYEKDKLWYKYIFTDGRSESICNINLMKKIIEQNTHARYVEAGILWGVTRYSLVCLTDEGNRGEKLIRVHLLNIYQKMVIIILAQRTSILKFSNDLSRISAHVRDNSELNELKEIDSTLYLKLEKIKAGITHFENHLWFSEVTPQEQGIEMYQMIHSHMKLEDQFNFLKQGIDDLYEYFELKLHEKQDKNVLDLTLIATYFFIISLFFGIWTFVFTISPNIISGSNKNVILAGIILFIGSSLIVYYLSEGGIKRIRTTPDDYRIWKTIIKSSIVPLLITVVIIVIIYFMN